MSIEKKRQIISANNEQIKAKLDDVFEAGKKAEYDAFWDSFQENGTRTAYDHGFKGWDFDLFYPKYDLICTKAMHLFYNVPVNANPETGKIEDGIATRLKKLGITLDVSAVTDVSSMFAYYKGIDVPYLDLSSATTANTVFSHASNIVTIEGIKISESVNLYNAFSRCDKLENITFEGVIANNINFKDCTKLTLASLVNIIHHLKDFTGGDEYSKTLFLSQASADILNADSESWLNSLVGGEKKWSVEVV